MSRRRKHCDSPGLTGSEESRQGRNSQNKTKTNKLSRTFRQTQQSPSLDSSYHCAKDVKTPRRHARIGFNCLNNADSPNDAELQQDIIWDATSPTPVRKDKKVKKFSRREDAVEISEIVNRIVPKDERPNVPESSLLQWIGDSAIPCTPEVRHCKTRKKSTRLNGVEDLMKLAKQFDINMIQQDKEQAKETCQQSADLHSGGTRQPNVCEGSPPVSPSELDKRNGGLAPRGLPVSAEELTDQRPVGHEDTLDALFDRSTQSLSGRLSDNSPNQSQEFRAVSTKIHPKSASVEKGVKEQNPGLPGGPTNLPLPNNEFEDDWDDDLLDDPFVLEMTLNPDLSIPPKHCSTQIDELAKGAGLPVAQGVVPPMLRHPSSHGDGSAMTSPGKNEKCKTRSTFVLETNPQFQANGALCGMLPEKGQRSDVGIAEKNAQGPLDLTRGPVTTVSGQRSNKITQHIADTYHEDAAQTVFSKAIEASSNSCSASSVQAGKLTTNGQGSLTLGSKGRPEKFVSAGPSSIKEVSDKNLSSHFTPDSLWDDEDDDLLCQLCDDVEKLSESQAGSPVTGVSANVEQRKQQPIRPPSVHDHVPPSHGARSKPESTFTRSFSVPGNHAPSAGALRPPTSAAASATQNRSASASGASGSGIGAYRFTQVKNASAMAGSALRPTAGLQSGDRKPHSFPSSSTVTEKVHQSSFKRHLSDPLTFTNKASVPSGAAVKCSEAEIERKKQKAMARRRLRLQQAQAPT